MVFTSVRLNPIDRSGYTLLQLFNRFGTIFMKQILLIGLLSLITACSQHSSVTRQAHAHSTLGFHTGDIDQQQLLSRYPAFASQFQSFQPTAVDKAQMASIKESIQIVVLFGTWCHDSQREVPRLLKLLQGSENIQLKLFAVNTQKSDTQGVARQHQLRYTPTFIVIKNGQEIGRIVEKPTQSLAQDLVTIIQG